MTPMPTISHGDERACGPRGRVLVGESEPGGFEDGLESDGDDEPEADPDDGGQGSDDEGLADDGPGDLAGARPDSAEEGELAGALADDDREGVVDEEGGHEQGDGGEARAGCSGTRP